MQLPEEFTRPPKEAAPLPEETAPLSDEYNRGAPGGSTEGKKRKLPMAAIAALLSAAMAITGGGAAVSRDLAEKADAVELQEPAPERVIPDTPESQPQPEPEPEPEPEASLLPELISTPLGDGLLQITVYNDDPDPDNGWRNRVLYRGILPEADFTTLELPEPYPLEGYESGGYVLYYGEFREYDGYNDGDTVFALPVGMTLTAEQLELVPVYEQDQTRYVELHAVWLPVTDRNELLYLDGVPAPFVIPLASEGRLWLCALESPRREGYVFDCWLNEAGEAVTFVDCGDMYLDRYDENGRWVGTELQPVSLTSHWLPE